MATLRLQVRRSSYHEVIRVSALRAVADVSLVQTYANNGESVVFLNRRPLAPQHAKMSVSFAGLCLACDRGLVDQAFRFCSLACKVRTYTYDPNVRSFPFFCARLRESLRDRARKHSEINLRLGNLSNVCASSILLFLAFRCA